MFPADSDEMNCCPCCVEASSSAERRMGAEEGKHCNVKRCVFSIGGLPLSRGRVDVVRRKNVNVHLVLIFTVHSQSRTE